MGNIFVVFASVSLFKKISLEHTSVSRPLTISYASFYLAPPFVSRRALCPILQLLNPILMKVNYCADIWSASEARRRNQFFCDQQHGRRALRGKKDRYDVTKRRKKTQNVERKGAKQEPDSVPLHFRLYDSRIPQNQLRLLFCAQSITLLFYRSTATSIHDTAFDHRSPIFLVCGDDSVGLNCILCCQRAKASLAAQSWFFLKPNIERT